jgi:signal transduction histidine kinase
MARPITELTEKAKAVARGVPQVAARRSAVREIDQLGVAISEIATVLGSRLDEAETATDTLEVVLGALPVGTILVGEDDDLTYANDAARELIGTIPERLEQLSPHPLQATARAVRTSHAVEARVFEMGKPPRQLRVLATPFAEDDRVLLTIADITARERADAVRRDFVANASHELKTPVATIIAASEALQIAISRGDESAVGFSSQIEMSARQLDRLVTDLLDLSRLEREKPELSPVRLDLLVREEVERLRSRAEENDLSIEVKVVEATAMASRRDIAIAIRNLLDNAVRYTPSGGSIGVGLDLSDGQVVLTVRDTGDGVPTRDLERIFERFYRVDSARSRSTGGTGLGLSIVKHVVESHGGTVGVESELGAGSVFTVRLPLADEGQPTDPN